MIILSHTTALHCLRHLGAEAVALLPRLDLSLLAEPFDSPAQAVQRYLEFSTRRNIPIVPLHVLKRRGSHAQNSDLVLIHTAFADAPHPLIALGDGVYCVAPELLIRQLSSWGNVYELAYLAYELCGIYAHPGNEQILIPQRKSFTTKAQLAEFLSAQPSFPKSKTVERVVQLVHDRSASPMETASAMLLGFPCRLGGLGFPDFEMNKEIVVPRQLVDQIGRKAAIVDLCWLEKKVVLEYDSSMWHSGPEQIAKDARKRTALTRLGYKVVTLTGGQAAQSADVTRVADALAKELGHRIQPRCQDYQAKRRALERTIFRDKASIFDAMPSPRTAHLHPKLIDPSALNQ